MTTAGVNSNLITATESDLAGKRFAANPKLLLLYKNVTLLDPIPNKDEQTKSIMEMDGITTKDLRIVSSNINQLVKEAFEINPDFDSLGFEEKQKALRETPTYKEIATTAPTTPTPE